MRKHEPMGFIIAVYKSEVPMVSWREERANPHLNNEMNMHLLLAKLIALILETCVVTIAIIVSVCCSINNNLLQFDHYDYYYCVFRCNSSFDLVHDLFLILSQKPNGTGAKNDHDETN